MMKAHLQQAGIRAVELDNEVYGKLLPILVGELGVKRLLVEECDLLKAKEIVSSVSNFPQNAPAPR